MDDMIVMMQDDLRHALSGLLPPHAAAIAPTVEPAPDAIPPATVIPPTMDALTSTPIDNVEGQPMNVTRNVPNPEVKLEKYGKLHD